MTDFSTHQTPDTERPKLDVEMEQDKAVLFEPSELEMDSEPTHWIRTDVILNTENMR